MASENEKVPHWESLIAAKMRPCAKICEVEDPVRRNNLEKTRRWHKEHPEYVREAARRYREKHKNDPEYRAKKLAYDRGYRERKKLLKQQGPMECSQEEQA